MIRPAGCTYGQGSSRRMCVWLVTVFVIGLSSGGAQVVPSPQHPAHNSLAAMRGEYQGAYKGAAVRVWVEPLPVDSGPFNSAALLVFREARREALIAHMQALVADIDPYYREMCANAIYVEEDQRYYISLPYTGIPGAGLALLRDDGLEPDWERIGYRTGRLINEEYIQLRGKEYAIKKLRRDPDTGLLRDIQFTRTGFLQNPFANPVVRLQYLHSRPAEAELLLAYLRNKSAAMEDVQRYEPGTAYPAICDRF